VAGSRGSTALADALGVDPEAVLIRDPGLLLDPRFLGGLHAELETELGREQARVALAQIGFLHGLRDASRVLRDADGRVGPQNYPAIPAALPIRYRSNPGAQPRGALEFEGTWPEHQEATARLERLGAVEGAACAVSAGYTSGWLSGLFDADLVAIETNCCAAGEPACRFVAREADVWREEHPGAADEMVEALPFQGFRQVLEHLESRSQEQTDAEGRPVVHIWGPVMVLPFVGADEALAALDLLRTDPNATQVSVVVIALSGVVLDEGFGAAALEQMLESLDAWGADTIFAGVSTLSLPVVADLALQPVLVHKDVDAAIAAAFQIAESQRRLA
jgi:hypothetical protein